MKPAIHRLLREWAMLAAIFAMVLGPLALGVSRSLAAQERVQVAAGIMPLPLCHPGDAIDGLAAKTGGGACDHCTAALNGPLPGAVSLATVTVFTFLLEPANTEPSALLAQIQLPPATGPPIA